MAVDAGMEAMTRSIQDTIMANLGSIVVTAVQATMVPALAPLQTTIELIRTEAETHRVEAETARREDR
jgi:hypothetical protein